MDNVKVIIQLEDKFSDKMRKITKELITFTRVVTLSSSAIKKLTLYSTAASASFTVLNFSAKSAFNSIRKGSASASSKILQLTAQTALLGFAAKRASSAFNGMSSSKGTAASASSADKDEGSLLTKVGGAAAKSLYTVSKAALQLSSDAEQANVAFETLLGSSDKAKEFSSQLAAFSNKSPFELPEIREASKKLLAYGIAADSVVPMLTAVGNATTGLGLGSEGFDEIASSLGKMKMEGKVSSEEMDKLVESGIPAWEILSKKIKVSTDDLKEMAEAGTLPADQALKDLTEGMNTRFPEAMAKQGHTLEGLFNQLKKTFENGLLQKWGDGISMAIQPKLEQLLAWITQNSSTLDQWGQMLQGAAFSAADAILNAFQYAFNYVKSQYLSNPEFMNLSIPAKIAFILDDLLTHFNTWLQSGGQQQISSVTESLTTSLVNGVQTIAKPLFPVALEIGYSLASGIIEGLEKTIAEHPLLMTLIGGVKGAQMGAALGPWGALIGGALGAGTGIIASYAAKNSLEKKELERSQNGTTVPTKNSSGTPSSMVPWNANAFSGPEFSHAGGLDRVPYNGYHALLHKDERVQTKAEADAWRSGSPASPIQFTFHYHGERMGESDIDNMLGIFVRKMEALNG